MFRLILVALFSAIPVIANAQAADGLLGPSSNSNGQSVGPSSTQSSNLLQPASKSDGESLQSTGTNGVTQSPDQSALQRPASADEAKLFISGDVDTEDDTGGSSLQTWAVVSGLVLGLVIIIVIVFRKKLRLPQLVAYQEAETPQSVQAENIPSEKVEEKGSVTKPKPAKRKKKSSKKKSTRRKSK